MEKWNDYLKSSRPLGNYQLYNAYEIVIRLQGQFNIDAGLVNQKWRPDLKTATYVECINDICILAAYRQFQTNNRASREICIQILIKIF